jgi:hypothetical protein
MGDGQDALDQLCINTIRMLAVDAVQKANSGHPGMPMGTAPMAEFYGTTLPTPHGPTGTGSSSLPATAPCSSTACCTSPDMTYPWRS